jgi:hypothetical protein
MRILDCWGHSSQLKCSLQINECKLHVEKMRDIVHFIKKTILSFILDLARHVFIDAPMKLIPLLHNC